MPTGLLVLMAMAAGNPPAAELSGPRLTRGDELVYRGEITEGSDRIDNRFRKSSQIEVRVLVLEVTPGHADCAVLTQVQTRTDAAIAEATVSVTGAKPKPTETPPAVTVDLVRVDHRGQVQRLRPPLGPPPLILNANTPTQPLIPNPIDGPPILETGLFVPLPTAKISVGETWDRADGSRPPVRLNAREESLWNGGRVIHLTSTQQTEAWDRPQTEPTGWRKVESVLASPSDGLVVAVRRRMERRDGASVVGWVEVKYDLEPPTRHIGIRYVDARKEAEAAVAFGSELTAMLTSPEKTDPREYQFRLLRIERFLADHPVPTGFRAGVEAVRRRCAAAAKGDFAPVGIVIPTSHAVPMDAPQIGKPAPEFVLPKLQEHGTVSLASLRSRPVVLVFYKPGSSTSRPTLIVAEALHKHFAEKGHVLTIAVAGSADMAKSQHEEMKLTMPAADGAGIRQRYQIDSYPRFLVLDRDGTLTWRFDGFGLETGYLVKQQVESLIPRGIVPTVQTPQSASPAQLLPLIPQP